MIVVKTLKQEDIICVNGEFYIFLTEAKGDIDITIESKEKFQT